jgi:hypothetical protein
MGREAPRGPSRRLGRRCADYPGGCRCEGGDGSDKLTAVQPPRCATGGPRRQAAVKRPRGRSSASLRRLRRDRVSSARQVASMSFWCAIAAGWPRHAPKGHGEPKAIGARSRQVARSARAAVDLTASTTMARGAAASDRCDFMSASARIFGHLPTTPISSTAPLSDKPRPDGGASAPGLAANQPRRRG